MSRLGGDSDCIGTSTSGIKVAWLLCLEVTSLLDRMTYSFAVSFVQMAQGGYELAWTRQTVQ